MHNGSVFHRKISFRGYGLGREPWAVFQSNLIPCSGSPRPTSPTAGRFQCHCRTSSAPCARTGADQIIRLYGTSRPRPCWTGTRPSGTSGAGTPPGRSIAFLQARPAGPRPQGAPDPRRKPAGHPPKTARNPPGHRPAPHGTTQEGEARLSPGRQPQQPPPPTEARGNPMAGHRGPPRTRPRPRGRAPLKPTRSDPVPTDRAHHFPLRL